MPSDDEALRAVPLAAPGFEPEHVVRYLREWAADQREREAWKDNDQSTYRFRARTLEGALAALLAARERAERAERERDYWKDKCSRHIDQQLKFEAEREGLAREVRRARKLRDKPGGLAVMAYDDARAANEAQGWPSGGEKVNADHPDDCNCCQCERPVP